MHPVFIDAEFSGLTQQARLLSLALVPAQGPWFYAVFDDVDTGSLSKFHQEDVVPHLALATEQLKQLPPGQYLVARTAEIVTALRSYLKTFEEIVIWADVPAYDWVLFCELFGGALSLPKNIHYIVRDLATLLEAKGYNIDTDRFALAYGKESEDATVTINPSDGRLGKGQTYTTNPEGLFKHNALGDALAARACFTKIMGLKNNTL